MEKSTPADSSLHPVRERLNRKVAQTGLLRRRSARRLFERIVRPYSRPNLRWSGRPRLGRDDGTEGRSEPGGFPAALAQSPFYAGCQTARHAGSFDAIHLFLAVAPRSAG